MGNLLAVVVHEANKHDTKSGDLPLDEAIGKYPSVKAASADLGYRKSFEEHCATVGVKVLLSQQIAPKTFVVQPKRWVVERTFAWAGHSRRLSKDYEILTESEETMFKISHCHTLLRRY